MTAPDDRLSGLRVCFAAGLVVLASTLASLSTPQSLAGAQAAQGAPDGMALYEAGCASCHGSDGRGAAADRIAFDDPLPDLTDCSFASREPDADWIIVSKAGGPVRGFSDVMPAFGEAFDDNQLQAVMDHIRTFCTDRAWPRGELNLPRPLFTEKAYPEDEWVWTTSANAEGPGAIVNELLYEKRFGSRNQVEIALPFGFAEDSSTPASRDGGPASDWGVGLGDIEIGYKRALLHNLQTIFSFGTEVKLPTGDSERGIGSAEFQIEPFLALGQILPGDAFIHLQAGGGLLSRGHREFAGTAEHDEDVREAFFHAVFGRTFTSGEFGRSWSPMVEVLGSTHLTGGARTQWDLVPQMQVTLNTRQHVMLNVGVRFPLTDADVRSTQFLVYFLWDWFDGGLFDGW
ncbi:c-type cytochrome [Candidatus Palauibacter irciniicola]|uniref:c-type cytochrome n=1 Tax=Candidatus Palauibacter irciniicola TaxID=3056733 RepID=UPI003B024BE5